MGDSARAGGSKGMFLTYLLFSVFRIQVQGQAKPGILLPAVSDEEQWVHIYAFYWSVVLTLGSPLPPLPRGSERKGVQEKGSDKKKASEILGRWPGRQESSNLKKSGDWCCRWTERNCQFILWRNCGTNKRWQWRAFSTFPQLLMISNKLLYPDVCLCYKSSSARLSLTSFSSSFCPASIKIWCGYSCISSGVCLEGVMNPVFRFCLLMQVLNWVLPSWQCGDVYVVLVEFPCNWRAERLGKTTPMCV